jgi:hypothetical protein
MPHSFSSVPLLAGLYLPIFFGMFVPFCNTCRLWSGVIWSAFRDEDERPDESGDRDWERERKYVQSLTRWYVMCRRKEGAYAYKLKCWLIDNRGHIEVQFHYTSWGRMPRRGKTRFTILKLLFVQ